MTFSEWIIGKAGKWLTKDIHEPRSYLSDHGRISYEVRPADVLLIEGRNRVSRIIKHITQSPWTHAALYIGRLHDIEDPQLREQVKKYYKGSPNKQLIIESLLGKGTIAQPLDHYKHDHLRICRPTGLSREDAQRVIAYAIEHLGRKYSVRHILDLARFLFPLWSIMPRRFRSSLFEHNAQKPTEEICSAMIAEAFRSVKFPILPLIHEDQEKNLELVPRNIRLFTPSDFDYSPFFSIIKYPIFSLDQRTLYRDLPWNRKGHISSDHLGIYKPPKKDENK